MTCCSIKVATLSQTSCDNSQWQICGERAQEQGKHEVMLHQLIPLFFRNILSPRGHLCTQKALTGCHLSHHFWTQAYLKAFVLLHGNDLPRTIFFLVCFQPTTWPVSSKASPILALWESAVTCSLVTFSMQPKDFTVFCHVLLTTLFFRLQEGQVNQQGFVQKSFHTSEYPCPFSLCLL